MGRTYNKEKDDFVNAFLNSKNIIHEIKVGIKSFTHILQSGDFRLSVSHCFLIPFENPEHWFFTGMRYDGIMVLLDVDSRSNDNLLAPETYEKIKDVCLNAEKNQLLKARMDFPQHNILRV